MELQQVLGMTPAIYERVAPYLTVYVLTGAFNPTLAGEKLRGVLHVAGGANPQYLVHAPGNAYSIHAQAMNLNGAVFVREAVIS